MATWFFVSAVSGYLLGSLPTGYLAGRLKGIDIRQWGSGATGGTNVTRTLGVGFGVGVGLFDIVKGTAAAYAGYRLAGEWGYALAGFGALFGHAYPVWLKFKGGKSAATGAGAVLLFHPWAFVVGVVAFFATVIPTRYVSLGSLLGAVVLWAAIMAGRPPVPHGWLVTGALVVVYVRHWENILRLAAGKEHKFGQKAKPKAEG